jgi:hypothetical protein
MTTNAARRGSEDSRKRDRWRWRSRSAGLPEQVEQRGSHRDGGLIGSEEDGAEEGCGSLILIELVLRMSVEYEGGADGRERTRLRGQAR